MLFYRDNGKLRRISFDFALKDIKKVKITAIEVIICWVSLTRYPTYTN